MNNDKRKKRRSQTAEYFTPPKLVDEMLDKLPPSAWEPSKTFIDPACGNGNMLVQVLRRKLANGQEPTIALKSIYGTDIMVDNIRECRLRLLKVVSHTAPISEEMIRTVFTNIVATPLSKYPNGSLDYAFDFKPINKDQVVKKWHRNITTLMQEVDVAEVKLGRGVLEACNFGVKPRIKTTDNRT
ncbi:MAG: SAM-dependent methyltransferase [Planctomycetota bacterium]|nr:SAM-dependent methyltransferase [Planctomycetota bacterium]